MKQLAALPFIACALIACSGSDSTDKDSSGSGGSGTTSGAGGSGSFAATGYKDDLNWETGEHTVPAGESLECYYTSATTDHEINVIGAIGKQGPGGHHITVYYTTDMKAPQHHPCTDAEMISWNMIAGASIPTSGEPNLHIPDGLAVKLPAGRQIVVQIHYINTTGKSEVVNDQVRVQTVATEDVKQFANYWALVDLSFTLPPNKATKRTTTCTFKDPLDTVVLLGHMHEYGTHFTLDHIDETGKLLETVYDTPWNPVYMTHPPIDFRAMNDPLKFPAGSRFRQTCDWANTTPDTIKFPTEMCVSFGIYYPDLGHMITCEGEPETPTN